MSKPKRFVISDETALDTRTGLTWQRGFAEPMPWHEALEYAQTLRLEEHDDWRVPTVAELVSIVEYFCARPAIDTEAFPGTPLEYFWTSLPRADCPTSAWGVAFDAGYVSSYGKAGVSYVRCVRDGH